MKRSNSSPRAFFSTLTERAGIITFARPTSLPTFNTQSASSGFTVSLAFKFTVFLASNK